MKKALQILALALMLATMTSAVFAQTMWFYPADDLAAGRHTHYYMDFDPSLPDHITIGKNMKVRAEARNGNFPSGIHRIKMTK